MLTLNGRYDTDSTLDGSQRPLFQFRTVPQDKKLLEFDGGHCAFPCPEAAREVLDWLDKYLGPYAS